MVHPVLDTSRYVSIFLDTNPGYSRTLLHDDTSPRRHLGPCVRLRGRWRTKRSKGLLGSMQRAGHALRCGGTFAEDSPQSPAPLSRGPTHPPSSGCMSRRRTASASAASTGCFTRSANKGGPGVRPCCLQVGDPSAIDELHPDHHGPSLVRVPPSPMELPHREVRLETVTDIFTRVGERIR